MEIGLFQLENITLSFMPFVFFDVRTDRAATHPVIDPLLARAEGVSAARVLDRLLELEVPKSTPIVLVCADGRSSAKARRALDAAGFEQIYTVEDGVAGLLRDVDL